MGKEVYKDAWPEIQGMCGGVCKGSSGIGGRSSQDQPQGCWKEGHLAKAMGSGNRDRADLTPPFLSLPPLRWTSLVSCSSGHYGMEGDAENLWQFKVSCKGDPSSTLVHIVVFLLVHPKGETHQ